MEKPPENNSKLSDEVVLAAHLFEKQKKEDELEKLSPENSESSECPESEGEIISPAPNDTKPELKSKSESEKNLANDIREVE